MKNNKGYTLVELLIIVTIVGVFVALFAGMVGSCGLISGPTVENRANEDAVSFVHQMRPEMSEVRAVCQPTDSDGDGYVTCTISGTVNGVREMDSVDCRASFITEYQRGCRFTRIPLQRQIRQ